MPFAGFKDFASCVASMSKKKNVKDAKAVCGKLQALHEKGKKK